MTVRALVIRSLGARRAVVYLFGSWATGHRHGASDIDVAIEAAEPLAPGLLARLRETRTAWTWSISPTRIRRSASGSAGRCRVDRLRERLTVAGRAVQTLPGLALLSHPTRTERDAAIQRCEYSFEATWRAGQRYLQVVEGTVVGSPKAAIRASRESGLRDATTTEQALGMADDRNLTAHTYNESIAVAISARLPRHLATLEAGSRPCASACPPAARNRAAARDGTSASGPMDDSH